MSKALIALLYHIEPLDRSLVEELLVFLATQQRVSKETLKELGSYVKPLTSKSTSESIQEVEEMHAAMLLEEENQRIVPGQRRY